ncbi:hypothetical protein [Virgibacillus sp. SK37]|uniref:hypothetical protein n=1 Tax=Virgibacillus sp. SK37 TaxID=403957 RepID=UPI0004D1EC52|nr:hypothetical protein [Virgibacillus sp. SK37]AIF45421.1 hypothetical protein X953_10095 [Virgibacillus sp. SK37]
MDNSLNIRFTNNEINTYKHFTDDDELAYFIWFQVNNEEYERFIDFLMHLQTMKDEYFKAEINGEERTVRFGSVSYSKHESHYKVQTVIVDKQADDKNNNNPSLNDEERRNLREGYINQKIVMTNLLDTLQRKGLLSEEDITEIHNISVSERLSERIVLSKVKDIDEYDL